MLLSFFPLFVNEMDGWWNEWNQIYDPNYPKIDLFIILKWFLFHFCWFWFDRVESIGYLIRWQTLKWVVTFGTLADMDHWESWKKKSIHPTSILEMRYDDQLIWWYFWYFRKKALLFIMWFIFLRIGEMNYWRLFYFCWKKEQKWMFKIM